MSYLNHLLKKVNHPCVELIGELRRGFKFSMKPVVVLWISRNFSEFSGKSLQISFKAHDLIINNCNIKSVQILIHKTNMQKYIGKIANKFGITIIRTYI